MLNSRMIILSGSACVVGYYGCVDQFYAFTMCIYSQRSFVMTLVAASESINMQLEVGCLLFWKSHDSLKLTFMSQDREGVYEITSPINCSIGIHIKMAW